MKTLLATLSSLVLVMHAHAALIPFDLQGTAGFGLLSGNEPQPLPNPTNASGGEIADPTPGNPFGIYFNDTNNVLTLNIGWGSSQGFNNLTTTAALSHIHGPTASNNGNGFTQTANVLFNLTRSSNAVTGGFLTSPANTITLTPAQVIDLNAGKYYVNIHTQSIANGGNPGGEIRGFIVPVPEPSTALLGLFGGASLLAFRRRR